MFVTTTPQAAPAPAGARREGTLAALVEEVHERLGRFDAGSCSGKQAAEVVAATVAIVRRCEAVRLQALARVAETDAWRADGSRSCRAWVMRTLDTSFPRAGQLVDTAARLHAQPHVDRLVAGGRVDLDRLLLASATVAARPDAAIEVCHAAEHTDGKAFRARCRRWRQAGETDEERAVRHRRDRRARLGVDDEGMVELRAAGPADEGAELRALFQPWVDDLLRESWVQGVPISADQARWDALLAMARAAAEGSDAADDRAATDAAAVARRGSTRTKRPASLARGKGSRAKVIVRVDLAALLRGWVAAGEVCDLPGVGEVDVAAIRRLIAQGAFVSAVLTTPGRDPDDPGATVITDVAHLGRAGPDGRLVPPDASERNRSRRGQQVVAFLDAFLGALGAHLRPVEDLVHDRRHPDVAQRTALEYLHPTCSVSGCGMAEGLEIDHVQPWAASGETRLTDLDRKCRPHHREKTARENAARRRAS